jgi:hypothetical protein
MGNNRKVAATSRGTARKKLTRHPKPPAPYPSLAQSPTPAERLAQLLEQAEANGARAGQDVSELAEEFPDLWPDDREIDAFIAWVHRGRRQGWYD